MRNSIALLVFIALFSACGGKQEAESVVSADKPGDLIPEDKMILVMADVHLLESAIAYRLPHGTSRTPFMISPTEQVQVPQPNGQEEFPYYDVFKKYGYTHDQYERSNEWYASDPGHYSEMYDEVITELTRRQVNEQKGSPPVQPNPDQK